MRHARRCAGLARTRAARPSPRSGARPQDELQEGEALLADFGIALAVKEAGGNRLTQTGLSLGTPQYMSPEQATGDRGIDARSDVYSLAAVLYETLAGEPPVSGGSVQSIIAKLMTETPTRLRVLRDSVSPALDAAVARALAKTPADRFTSVGEFVRATQATTATGEVWSASPIDAATREISCGWVASACARFSMSFVSNGAAPRSRA